MFSVYLKVALAHGMGVSSLEVYQRLNQLRKEPSFSWGEYKDAVTNDAVFSFVRQAEGFDGYLVVLNFGPNSATVDFGGHKDIPSKATVAASTSNFDDPSRSADFKEGTEVNLHNAIHLKKGEGVVFKWLAGAA